MIPPFFTVPRQIIYIILKPTYFTALCPPLKPIRSPSPKPQARDLPFPPASHAAILALQPPGCIPPPPPPPGPHCGARGGGQGAQGREGGMSGEKDAKGKRGKRRRWGTELALLQGLGGEGWPEHRRASKPSGWGGSGRSPMASGSQAPPGVRAEAGPRVVTGNTFTIQNSFCL